MATLATSFLIGSSSSLGITRKTITSWMSRIAELAALERLENPHRLIMGKCCGNSSTIIFQWIFFILAGNKDNYNISYGFEF